MRESPPKKSTSRTYWGAVSVLSAGHFTNDFYALYLTPLAPLLTIRFGLTGVTKGALILLFSLFASLPQPFMGWLGDRVRRHVAIVASMAAAAVMLSLLSAAPSLWMVVLLLIGGGLGVSVYHPNSGVMVREAAKGRDVAMAIFISSGALGVFAAPMFVGWCASEKGPLWLVPWSMVLGLGMAVVIAATRFHRSVRPVNPPRFQELFRRAHAPLYLLLVVGLLRALTQITFNYNIQFHVMAQAWDEVYQRLFTGAFLLAAAVGGITGGLLSNRLGRRRVIVVSCLAGGVLLFVAPLTHSVLPDLSMAGWPAVKAALTSPAATAVGLILGGLIFGAATPVQVVLGQAMAPKHAAAATGVMTGFAWGLGGLLMPAMGAIEDAAGPAWALRVAALATVLAGGLAMALREPARNQPPADLPPIPPAG